MSEVTFGAKLRELRENHHLSQDALAQELVANLGMQISQTYVSALERRSNPPRGEVLKPIASYFGVPIEHFYSHSQVAIDLLQDDLAELQLYLETTQIVVDRIQRQLTALGFGGGQQQGEGE